MRALRILFGLLVFLLAVAAIIAWTLPARVAWRAAAPRLPIVELGGIGGSVWHGRADTVSVAGLPLGRLEWRTEVLPLLHGDVRTAIDIDGDGYRITGLAMRLADGSLVANDVVVTLPAATLEDILHPESLRFAGEVRLDIREARLRNGWFTTLDGTGAWRGARIGGAAEVPLGDIDIRLGEEKPPTVTVEASDAGSGPLELEVRFAADPVSYDVFALMRPRDPGDLRLQETLQKLGPLQPDGSVFLQAEGRLLAPRP